MKNNQIHKEYAAMLRFRLQQEQHSVQQQRSSSNRGAAATVKCSTVAATVKLEHSSSKSKRTVKSAYQLQECISTALQHISIVRKQQHM